MTEMGEVVDGGGFGDVTQLVLMLGPVCLRGSFCFLGQQGIFLLSSTFNAARIILGISSCCFLSYG